MSKQRNQQNLVEFCRQKIRDAGLRATPGRIAVLSQLVVAGRPLTHAVVVERVGSEGTDPSTIFRALNDMTEAAILRRMELGDHVYRYEIAVREGESGDSNHAHFLCTECGEILCLENNQNKTRPAADPRIKEVTEVLFKGQCTDCE